MKVVLNQPVDVVVVPEQKKSIAELTIVRMIDNPTTKSVVVMTKEVGRIVLWEGAEYDSIGQWTDTDVQNKIKSLY